MPITTGYAKEDQIRKNKKRKLNNASKKIQGTSAKTKIGRSLGSSKVNFKSLRRGLM